MQYANEKPADPIELRIYPGADGNFTLYEDEGDSYRYEKGVYATISIQWKESSQTLIIGKRKGEFPGILKERTLHIETAGIRAGVIIGSLKEAMTAPFSKMSPEQRCQEIIDGYGGYRCGIGRYIQCREGYDAFLEMEPMGGKIRDSMDEYIGCPGRDDKTKFIIASRYAHTNATLRFWGSTFKPVLNVCKEV